jgi:hypothetical protein
VNNAALQAANKQRLETPLNAFFCPTRRAPVVSACSPTAWIRTPILCAELSVLAKCDYAGNGGENYNWFGYGPGDLGSAGSYFSQSSSTGQAILASAKACTGVIYCHTQYKVTDVEDGLSNTFALGEKYIDPDYYDNAYSLGDDQGPFVADERDAYRAAAWDLLGPAGTGGNWMPPAQDQSGIDNTFGFGSAHAGGLYFAMCDGSVHFINYTISEPVYRHLANRKDGVVIDPSQLQ